MYYAPHMRGERFVRRRRNGLSLVTQFSEVLGRTDRRPRFAGVALSAPDRDASWVISRQIADGEYSYPGLRPRRGDRVVDIGANIGVYALWASMLGAQVVAYEPAPDTFRHLVTNVRGRAVTPIHAAVVGHATVDRTARLFLHDQRSTRNTLVGHEIDSRETLKNTVEIPSVSIQDVLREPCNLLKVDCEGAEFELLDAASDTTLRAAERVVMEFHRSVGEPASLVDRLAAAGFEARVLGGADPDVPFGVIGAIRQP